MAIPLYSTLTLFTEILITAIIIYVFVSGYKKNKFPFKLAALAMIYEIAFNISYMVYRTFEHASTSEITEEPVYEIVLAAFHGVISLIMFIALIVFLSLAWKNYKKGINYFKQHKNLTIVFLIFWFLAVISGIAFYFVEYLF